MKWRFYENTGFIILNGNEFNYIFNEEVDSFKKQWDEQIESVGYFSGYDYTNAFVIINPSQCGIIEFNKKYTNRI